jgi:hypothetical protein
VLVPKGIQGPFYGALGIVLQTGLEAPVVEVMVVRQGDNVAQERYIRDTVEVVEKAV